MPNRIKINRWLLPLSWLYGLGVDLRNALFNLGVLHSYRFSIPVISVGNITVGGTGKTPHVEYLIRLFENEFKVAVLSRGYRRKTKGFIIANDNSTPHEIGDEPSQMKHKFPNVTVAVDANRVRGIEKLCKNDKKLEIVLLDDAFQHRYVKPGINILLIDFNRLIIDDYLLPAGRLREPIKGKNRADIVIVTKCPQEQTPTEFRAITRKLSLYPYQQIYFTTLEYEELKPVFTDLKSHASPLTPRTNVLLITGIASPKQIEDYLIPKVATLTSLTFSDHHNFRPRDVESINQSLETLPHPRCIITTEKDAARLRYTKGLSEEVRSALYCLPIRISFLLGNEQRFNENLISYVRKNSRNSILAQGTDDNKPQDGDCFGDGTRTISFRDN